MKKEIEIFIIGGTRALAVYSSLRKRYTQVYYFRNERECRKSMYLNPDVLIIDESLKNSDPMLFLSSINELSDAHIIYLSKNNHFN